jgi:hypothetical protein
LRSFIEKVDKSFRITPISMKGGLEFLVEAALDDASRAASFPQPVVFCPPIALFGSKDSAKEKDLLAGLALSVELDENPLEAVTRLEDILGPPTVTVISGGIWEDPETGQIFDRLHAHWRLSKAAKGADLAKLKEARILACDLHRQGGDATWPNAGVSVCRRPIGEPPRNIVAKMTLSTKLCLTPREK